MKKAYVFGVLALLASFVAMGALYQFYVKKSIDDLAERKSKREEIEGRVQTLQQRFYQTKPEIIIGAWRDDTQPWATAVMQQARFFRLEEIPEGYVVPEEEIPKFFYKKIFPKMVQDLADYAYEKNCIIPPNLTFGAPSPDLSGTNPTKEEVEKWLSDYQYGDQVVRFVVDSGASEIITLNLWPEQIAYPGRLGKMETRTIGLNLTIGIEELVSFLDGLRTSERYFSVKSIMITNSTLLNKRASLDVKMVLEQAQFVVQEEVMSADGGATAGARRNPSNSAINLFSAMALKLEQVELPSETSWWQKFRQRWLPF